MSVCKHCKQEFDISDKPKGWMANHSRWCDKNPKRSEYKNGSLKAVEAMNASRKRSGIKNQYSYGAKCSEETKEKIRIASTGRKHTEETKRKISEIALKQTHRRLKKGVIEYKGILLDSSWELELAKRLDELEVKWVRPDPIPWIDEEGVTHNYFPDFYLEDYDLYLDPKNPHAIKVQKKKLDRILTQYKNIVIIDSLEKCKQYSV